MNEKHQLDAPNNDSLQAINQLQNHPELSSLYPEAKQGWDGTLMSEASRATQRDKDLEFMTTSIQARFWAVGLLIATPLFITAIVMVVLSVYVYPLNTGNLSAVNIVPTIIGSALCLGVSASSLRAASRLFYQHTLRLGPFLAIMWTLLGLSAQALYIATLPLHHAQPVAAVLYISFISLLWSMLLSFILLRIWTSPRLAASAKSGLIALVALLVVLVTVTVSAVQFFI